MPLTGERQALDRWTLGYLAVATGVLGWRWPDIERHRLWLILAHVLIAVLVILASHARRQGPLGRFVGDWYPLLILVGLYAEIGVLNLAGGTAYDATVQRWEQAVFHGQPSREWIRAQPAWWVSWPLHLGYLAYYPIVVGTPLALWVADRRDAARRTILLMMVTFYLCYAAFLFFPVAGPRYAFAHAENAATASGPANLIQSLLDLADSWGAAFPSSHVAAALVAAVTAWQGWRVLGRLLLPLAALLTAGTVYGQFHYALDALAGVMVAVLVLGVDALIGAPRHHAAHVAG